MRAHKGRPSRAAWIVTLVILACVVPHRAWAAIERAIDEVEQAAARCDPLLGEKVAHLNTTIADGKGAIVQLRAQNSRLAQEKASLVQQKLDLQDKQADLERVQTTLTSGLIGALITALVAIAGAFLRAFSVKFDRDFRRAEVIEKLARLQKEGVPLPAELTETYLGRT